MIMVFSDLISDVALLLKVLYGHYDTVRKSTNKCWALIKAGPLSGVDKQFCGIVTLTRLTSLIVTVA